MRSFFRIISTIVLAVLIFGGTILAVKIHQYNKKIAAIEVRALPFHAVASGTYTGTCDLEFIKATVQTTLDNGRMTSLKILEHKNGKGKQAESLIDSILKYQTMEVDAVSGATASSKAILTAVQTALEEGLKQQPIKKPAAK